MGRTALIRPCAPRPFLWDPNLDWKKLRVGYAKSLFEERSPSESPPENLTPEELKEWESGRKDRAAARARREYDRRYDLAALAVLRKMGVDLQSVELPDLPLEAMALLLNAEAAAAFDDLTLTGRDEFSRNRDPMIGPTSFAPPVFIRRLNISRQTVREPWRCGRWRNCLTRVDIIIAPSSSDAQLILTNLTGHPAVIVPNGFRGKDAPKPPSVDTGEDDSIGGPGTPVSLTFLGRLYHDSALLAFASAYQQATDFHRLHPPGFE